MKTLWMLIGVFVLGGIGGCAMSPNQKSNDETSQDSATMPSRIPIQTDQWRGEIDRFLVADRGENPPRGGVLFYGSSTIRLWDVERFFPDRPVTNRGFGGATLPGALRYMHLVVLPYEPAVIVLYCGTNDIAEGQPAEYVVEDFVRFARRVHEALPGTHVLLLGIAPSVSRWEMWEEMTRANRGMAAACEKDGRLTYVDQSMLLLDEAGLPIPSLFTDGLHLSETGYVLLSKLIENELKRLEADHPSIRSTESRGPE